MQAVCVCQLRLAVNYHILGQTDWCNLTCRCTKMPRCSWWPLTCCYNRRSFYLLRLSFFHMLIMLNRGADKSLAW